MAVKRGFVWVFLVLSIVLAAVASAVYYWSKDSTEGRTHPVRGPSLLAAGREDSEYAKGLPGAAQTAVSGEVPVAAQRAGSAAVRSKPLPRSPFPPRQAVEVALQSGKPKDAFLAAWAIRRCSYLFGATQKTLEKVHERGVRVAPKVLADTISPIESAERMCQELDEPMKAQYEPMLRKAMEGGEAGAAALWWATPEAKAFGDASGERAVALDLLRRDAKQCELGSFNAYKVAAAQFHKIFDANEVAAVYAATDQLFRDRKLKNNTFEKVMELFPVPHGGRPSDVDENIVAAMTVKILSYCD